MTTDTYETIYETTYTAAVAAGASEIMAKSRACWAAVAWQQRQPHPTSLVCGCAKCCAAR
uniref:Uncharacterized protein n=1 Tax=viral metagenome TaxID=1070528 RepID=A0A6H1ZBP6_9ZZZZ